MFGKVEDIIEINCGGRSFSTFKSTLQKYPGTFSSRDVAWRTSSVTLRRRHLIFSLCFSESFLGALFSRRHPLTRDKKGRVFLDKNPTVFEAILDFLRTGHLIHFTDPALQELLLIELEFYGLAEALSAALPGCKEFKFSSPMDTDGLFYHFGCNNGTSAWKNPAPNGKIAVQISSRGGAELHCVVDRKGSYSIENDYGDPGPQWLSIRLSAGEFQPTGYWLKQEGSQTSIFFC